MHIHTSICNNVYSSTDAVRHENPNEFPSRLNVTGFLYDIAQINQKCIYIHPRFHVFKQSFLR